MRLKSTAQPLVFRFRGASALCCAAAALYGTLQEVESSLCLYRGDYYLKVGAKLSQRQAVREAACPFGDCLGAGAVLYAYCEEHGRCLSANAIQELGGAFWRR